ncbi:hypothetical protein ACFX13_012470 [Malus domestica]
MDEPLLSSGRSSKLGEKGSEKWSSYEYVGRAGSVIPIAALVGTDDSDREAAADCYPSSIHVGLVSGMNTASFRLHQYVLQIGGAR